MYTVVGGRFGKIIKTSTSHAGITAGSKRNQVIKRVFLPLRLLPSRSYNGHWPFQVVIKHDTSSSTSPALLSPLNQNRCFIRTLTTNSLQQERPFLHSLVGPQLFIYTGHARHSSTFTKAAGAVGKFLRVRYLILVGVMGGGVTAKSTYESWKDKLPDLEWMLKYMPEESTLDKLKKPLQKAQELKGWLRDNLPNMPNTQSLREMLDQNRLLDNGNRGVVQVVGATFELQKSGISSGNKSCNASMGLQDLATMPADQAAYDQERQDSLNNEIISIQTKYQREVDRLEKENKDLRKQLNLMEVKTGRKRSMNKSLIDMYSEILDNLSDFDTSYNTQDHLPRVVVVGDQSSGKTSVLEMVARARIFPRGSGEMMTRSPVKVTLSEGPYHVAQFKDSSREYDLTSEEETEALRNEVEHRMKSSVKTGQTVSTDCISMTVRGPGLQRLVLVDLPGIISTETTGMAKDTKESIKKLVKSYMNNPNAIILCIQDGSLDAERSNVTDVVSQIDPSGKRTIFVLTKMDLAENNLYNPNRIKSILRGELFPMKALGYFAVVTGKGNTDDSIDSIREYETDFFQNSKLLKDGALKYTQTSTQNLGLAVSELFWKMVKENVEQQCDSFKATRYNLETEWKNNFPQLRELDREELFERARGEILDEIVSLGSISHKKWENLLYRKLWEKTATHVFENIYLPASASAGSLGEFNTMIDIKLTDWANNSLPKKSVEVGWDVLHQQFEKLVDKDGGNRSKYNELEETIHKLKLFVLEDSKAVHEWDSKAEDSLRVIQRNILEDRSVHDKTQWDSSISFMEETLKEQLKNNQQSLSDLTGPGYWAQWLSWSQTTEEHQQRLATKHELQKMVKPSQPHKSGLSQDEITAVRQTLSSKGIEVDAEFIKDTWYHVFRGMFIDKALQQCNDCKKGFYHYQNGIPNDGLDCHEVVLFWRLQRMLQVTSNALRQQVVNNEARRLERIIKDLLDDFGEDSGKLKKLLTGRPVELAEELKKVRQIQDKLEEFIEALNRE